MVRQAQSYLAGAASSAALLAAAIATFVLLASFTAFREWSPLSFGGSGSETVNSPLAEPPAAAQAAAAALAPATSLIAATTPVPSGSDIAPRDSGFGPIDIGPTPPVGPGPSIDPLPPIDPTPPVNPPVIDPPPVDTGRQEGPVGDAVDNLDDTVTETTGGLGLSNSLEQTTETLIGPDTVLGNTVETTVNVLGGTLRGILGDHRP
jgi:hypothetical protein